MITDQSDRTETLVGAGVPSRFLTALETLEVFDELRYIIKMPKSAYFYLPQIQETHAYLRGKKITPIYDGSNGDTYYVLLQDDDRRRFCRIHLECEEPVEDFGSDFRYMLTDLIIKLYEFSQSAVDELASVGVRLGLKEAPTLLAGLERADREGLRKTFDADRKWRESQLASILSQS